MGKQEVTLTKEREGSDKLKCIQKIDLLREKSNHSELNKGVTFS